MTTHYDSPKSPLNACGQEHSHNGALMNGYTRPVTATGGDYVLFLMVRPDADLGGAFKAFDTDECEMVSVNGWLFAIEEGH